MKIWILLVFLVLLVLMRVREGFEATDLIKDPTTWDTAEYARIRAMVTPASTATDEEIRNIVGGFFSKWKEEDYRITMDEVSSYISSKNVAPARRAEFTDMVKAYYIDQGQSVFQQAAGYISSFSGEDTAGQFTSPTCPTNYTLATDGTGKCKHQNGTAPPVEPTCPDGYNLTFDNPPRCRNPNAAAPPASSSSSAAPASSSSSSSSSSSAAPPASSATAPSSLTDPGTGGSTSFFSQPNSGQIGSGKQVFGPAFTSLGASAAGGSTSDSTTTTQYPELLGGGVEPSTQIGRAHV
jgi:hypothetical protein